MAVELAYKDYGAGSPLVILHGLFGSGRNWHTIAERLADRYHVYTVDLRNHGGSPWAEPMTYSEMVDDLRIFLGDRGIERASVLGHSLGGKTAMLFALLYGHMVEAVVVVDIAPTRYTHTHLPIVQAMQRVDFTRCASRADVEAQLAGGVADPALRTFLMQNVVSDDGGYAWRINLAALAASMGDLLAFPVMPDLAFTGPALFVSGDASDYVSAERHRQPIRTFFPAAEFVVIPEAGHRVHVDQPERFLEAVGTFLDAELL